MGEGIEFKACLTKLAKWEKVLNLKHALQNLQSNGRDTKNFII